MSPENMTQEERIARLEMIVEKLLKLADNHPMGKMFVKMLGL